MIVGRCRRLAGAAALAAAVAGCGLGPGPTSDGEATLTVTRDYGAEPIVSATVSDPTESETAIRLLDREAEITTRYGGGFVQSIEGISGSVNGGRSSDWFFFVDGVESPVGSAERQVLAGHRVWWDYRDWTDAMRVPAVVGSWPEPFAQVAEDDPLPVRIECHGSRAPCETVAERLDGSGVQASIEVAAGEDSGPALRVLVGPWAQLRRDETASQLDEGPATSGVFARFERARGAYELVGLDPTAEPAPQPAPAAGLIAALRLGERPPTWLVTGGDPAAVEQAAEVLDADHLADRYAVAVAGGETLPLPAEAGQ